MNVPNPAAMIETCERLRLALAHVQCAVLDLHEAFIQRDTEQLESVRKQAAELLARVKA